MIKFTKFEKYIFHIPSEYSKSLAFAKRMTLIMCVIGKIKLVLLMIDLKVLPKVNYKNFWTTENYSLVTVPQSLVVLNQ